MLLRLTVLALSLLSCAVFSNTKVSVFYSSLPPYEDVSVSGEAQGIGIDALREFFNKKGLDVSFEFDSIARGLAALNRGDVDFSTAIAPSKKLKSKFWVSSAPLYEIQLGVFRLPTTEMVVGVSNLPALEVVSLKETKFYFLEETAELLETSKNHHQVTHFDIAANLVRNKRLDYFLSYYYPEKHGEFIEFEFDELMTLPVYLILSKQHPKASALKDYLTQQ